MTEAQLAALAKAARPTSEVDYDSEGDYGSERQVKAFNAFTSALEEIFSPGAMAEFEAWCLKATNDEIIDEGLRRARIWYAIAIGGGQTCNVGGVLAALTRAGFKVVPK